jgi:hypothetical protein
MSIAMPRLPMPPTDKEALAKNTKAAYEALGRFVEAFELMVDEVRGTCTSRIWDAITEESDVILATDFNRRRGLIEIPFQHQNMTAKPLWDIMRSIIADILADNEHRYHADRDNFKQLLGFMEGEYSALYNKRNSLLHGTWLIGYTSELDPHGETFRVRKFKTTGDGLVEETELPHDVTELSSLTNRCDKLRTWVAEIDFCLRNAKPWPLSKHFKKEGGVWFHRLLPSSEEWTTLPKRRS